MSVSRRNASQGVGESPPPPELLPELPLPPLPLPELPPPPVPGQYCFLSAQQSLNCSHWLSHWHDAVLEYWQLEPLQVPGLVPPPPEHLPSTHFWPAAQSVSVLQTPLPAGTHLPSLHFSPPLHWPSLVQGLAVHFEPMHWTKAIAALLAVCPLVDWHVWIQLELALEQRPTQLSSARHLGVLPQVDHCVGHSLAPHATSFLPSASQSKKQVLVVSGALHCMSPQAPVVDLQSAGQLLAFSPLSHVPLPQTGPALLQSAGQLLAVSPLSHVPLPQTGPALLQSAGQLLAVSPFSHSPLPHFAPVLLQSAGQLLAVSPSLHLPSPHFVPVLLQSTGQDWVVSPRLHLPSPQRGVQSFEAPQTISEEIRAGISPSTFSTHVSMHCMSPAAHFLAQSQEFLHVASALHAAASFVHFSCRHLLHCSPVGAPVPPPLLVPPLLAPPLLAPPLLAPPLLLSPPLLAPPLLSPPLLVDCGINLHSESIFTPVASLGSFLLALQNSLPGAHSASSFQAAFVASLSSAVHFTRIDLFAAVVHPSLWVWGLQGLSTAPPTCAMPPPAPPPPPLLPIHP